MWAQHLTSDYIQKYKSLDELPQNARVVVPNDPVNQGRALLLLQQAKLIQLKDPNNYLSKLSDITVNPKNLKFIEVEGPQTARAIDDVDLAFGYPHYLRLAKTADPNSALLLDDTTNKRYAILFVVRDDYEDKDDKLKKFIEIYQNSPAVKQPSMKTLDQNFGSQVGSRRLIMVSFGSQVDFSPPHIQIRALNKSYTSNGQTVQALKAIDLDIPQGKILGVIGKSGAGKSSLLRTLNGLETPSSGSIKIHQDELTTLDHAQLIHLRQKIGMIFQHFNLMSAKTVWDNVALPLKIAGLDKVEIQRRVDEVLGLVDLAHKAGQYPSQLSGGQKQRVGIARALVHHPEILLCDEATSALDPESTATVLSLLKRLIGIWALRWC